MAKNDGLLLIGLVGAALFLGVGGGNGKSLFAGGGSQFGGLPPGSFASSDEDVGLPSVSGGSTSVSGGAFSQPAFTTPTTSTNSPNFFTSSSAALGLSEANPTLSRQTIGGVTLVRTNRDSDRDKPGAGFAGTGSAREPNRAGVGADRLNQNFRDAAVRTQNRAIESINAGKPKKAQIKQIQDVTSSFRSAAGRAFSGRRSSAFSSGTPVF